MILKSFIQKDLGLVPIEVEVMLAPGLPQISILGLPDKVIQESAKRVQSALLAQGFQMPKAKQVLVSLTPRQWRKSSLGLDLAMALGILSLTGQRSDIQEGDTIYGELSLSGEVRAPADVELLHSWREPLITGFGTSPQQFPLKQMQTLKSEMQLVDSQQPTWQWQRPKFPVQKVSAEWAKVLSLVAVGEHPTLLAGPPGGGKSTFVELISALIAEPKLENFFAARTFDPELRWRPVLSPHHSISALGMVGGAVPPRPGEITKAHGGVLILEELLEFHPQVQSALREPFEKGVIHLSRGTQSRTYPAQFLTLATTNLCKCGDFSPGSSRHCRCSSTQLRKYMERLSGPFVDRFSCLLLTHSWKVKDHESVQAQSVSEVLGTCEKARAFAQTSRGQQVPNAQLSLEEVEFTFEDSGLKDFLPSFRSHRRRQSLLRVARTLADLEGEEKLKIPHLREAQSYTLDPFVRLRELL